MKLLYILVVLLSACAKDRVNDNVVLPPGKLYIESNPESEVVYKDEHNTGSSCRIWH